MFSAGEHKAITERDEALAELDRARAGVTVCITYHDEPAEMISNAINSVFAQTVIPYEILVIDDGSTKPFSAPFGGDYLRVIRVTNRGLPAARNAGLMLARAAAFLPLDADDWLDPTYIEKTLPLLADADVVLTGLQEHGETRFQSYMPGFDRPYDQVDEAILWQYNRLFYCSLFRTSLLREIGGYNPRMAGWPGVVSGGYEDWDVWLDLKRRGGVRFAAVQEALFNYRTKSEGSMLAAAEQNRDVLVAEMRRHHRC